MDRRIRRGPVWARNSLAFIALAFLLGAGTAAAASAAAAPSDPVSTAAASAAAAIRGPAPVVGIHRPAGADVTGLVELYAGGGFEVVTLDDRALERLPEAGVSLLVIPPGAKFPAAARRALSDFLRNRGSMAVLAPTAFDYAPGCTDPLLVTALAEGGRDYRLVTAAPGDTAVSWEAIPGAGGAVGMHIATNRVGLGDIVVEIPVAEVRDPDRTVLCFAAKGGYNVDILYLRLIDLSGQAWFSFVELDREWKQYAVSLADFRLRSTEPGTADAVIDPANIGRLTMGMARSLLWTERPGSFGIGPVYLGSGSARELVPTSEVLKWRVQFEHYGIRPPEWVVDPFLDAERYEGDLSVRAVDSGRVIPLPAAGGRSAVWRVPPPVSERGREDVTLQEVFQDRHDVRRIPLLEIVGEGGRVIGNAAEIRLFNGGYYRGSSMALFGIENGDYRPGTELGEALLDASRYLVLTPRIQRVTANAHRNFVNPLELSLEVLVSNPFDFTLEGEIEVRVADGLMKGTRTFALRPRTTDTVRVAVGAVPKEFPFLDFTWSVELKTAHGGDAIRDRVRAEEVLIEAAKHMMTVQESHEDGRFSHYFFQDIYGARAMLALGLHLQDPEISRRNQEVLDGLSGDDFIRSALRFADMLVERQREDGAFPMGYHEHRGMHFIADLGSLALGLVQMASWLDEPRRTAYLEAVKKYFELRETFYISEERAETLRKLYGGNSQGIVPGSYGLGFLGMDYFSGASWPETRREPRGPWWVLPVSMGFNGGMARLGQGLAFEEVARRDALEYLRAGYSAESHFHSEGVFWLYYGLDDPQIKDRLLTLLRRTAIPAVLGTRAYDWFDLAGRGALRWLVPVYFRNFIEDIPDVRVAIVRALWEMGSKSASFSIRELGERYPSTVYGPAVDTLRYAAFGSIWLMELVKPGSTLLRGIPPGMSNEPPVPQDIYLLIGQSNMAGRAPIEALDLGVVAGAYLFTGTKWEPLRNPVNRYSTVIAGDPAAQLGPGYTFAQKLVAMTGRTIGIVANARGGTRLLQWQKGYSGDNDFDLYEEAVKRARAALEATPGARLAGIIWHQGEGDNSSGAASLYLSRLSQLVSDLRRDLNAPGAVFIAGEVGMWNGRGTFVNPQIRRVGERIENAHWVSAAGLVPLLQRDGTPRLTDPHFNTLSQRVLGLRYADKALEVIYGISPGVATVYSANELFDGLEFTGYSATLPVGEYSAEDLARQGIIANLLRSARVEPGYELVVKTADGDLRFAGDVPDLGALGRVTGVVVQAAAERSRD